MAPISKLDAEAIASLTVLRYPDPRLREKALPLRPEDRGPALRSLVERMHELMAAKRGVGLAAPQVGVGARLFVANPTGNDDDRRTYLNPRIVSFEGSVLTEEGCLSVPGVATKIKRHARVVMEALDLELRPVRVEADGLLARIIQHEIDHLDGKLVVDRMGTVARFSHRAALQQLENEFAEAHKAATA